MKEEEAKTRWCPFARVPFHNAMLDYETPFATESAAGVNLLAGEDGETVIPKAARCIGSACMAWRWRTALRLVGERSRRVASDQGYCGLSGSMHTNN